MSEFNCLRYIAGMTVVDGRERKVIEVIPFDSY